MLPPPLTARARMLQRLSEISGPPPLGKSLGGKMGGPLGKLQRLRPDPFGGALSFNTSEAPNRLGGLLGPLQVASQIPRAVMDAFRAPLRPGGGPTGGDIARTAIDFTPVLGDIKAAAFDAPRSFGEGRIGTGLIDVASAVPILGAPFDVARRLRRGGLGVIDPPTGFTGGRPTTLQDVLGEDNADDFLYHITSRPNADRIAAEGFSSDAPSLMGRGGTFEANSRGRLFLTDKEGVGQWLSRAENHLFDLFDDPPDLAIVKVPKGVVSGIVKPDDIQDVVGSTSFRVDFADIDRAATAEGTRVAGEVATDIPGRWVSRLNTAVEGGQNTASAEQWAGLLRKAGGKSEREFAGVDEFLASRQGQQVTKAELLEHIDANGVKLTETVRGNEVSPTAARELDSRLEEIYRDQDFGANRPRSAELSDEARRLTLERDGIQYGNRPKFEQYTQPGGENYREILVQLDQTSTPIKVGDDVRTSASGRLRIVGEEGDRVSVVRVDGMTGETFGNPFNVIRESLANVGDKVSGTSFTGGHFDEPNVLTHLRTTDRTVNGEKTLFIEELQSDWHAKGRTEGYRGTQNGPTVREDANVWVVYSPDGTFVDVPKGLAPDAEGALEYASTHNLTQHRGTPGGVPDAPFKKTEEWVGLGFRRAIQEAVEGGYERIAWVSGEQAADLYDLRKSVSRIEYNADNQGLRAFDLNGDVIISEANVTPDRLPEFIGKEPAQRLIDASPQHDLVGRIHSIEGDDLAVGGEGMDTFYNRIVPNVVKKEAKALGVEIEPVRLPASIDVTITPQSGGFRIEKAGDLMGGFFRETRGAAEEIARELGWRPQTGGPTNLSIRITPQARDKILNEGQRIGATTAGTVAGTAAAGAVGAGIPLVLANLRGGGDRANGSSSGDVRATGSASLPTDVREGASLGQNFANAMQNDPSGPIFKGLLGR